MPNLSSREKTITNMSVKALFGIYRCVKQCIRQLIQPVIFHTKNETLMRVVYAYSSPGLHEMFTNGAFIYLGRSFSNMQ